MNDLFPVNTTAPISTKGFALKILEQLDSKTLLALGGMACLTTIVCVACVSFSGSEMALTKNGLSISQPNLAA